MKKVRLLLTVCIMGMAMLTLAGCSFNNKTVNLNKYVEIETEGYNTMGTAKYTFDYDAFHKDYGKKIKVKTKKKNNDATEALLAMEVWSGADADRLLLDYCAQARLDKISGLSNGDEVILSWNCDEDVAKKYFNCKLKYKDVTHKVKDLEEVGTFNPFDYLTIEYQGISPQGTVLLTPDYDKKEMQYIYFNSSQDRDLKNGDTITVTVNIQGGADWYAGEFGVIPNPQEKTFTVEGLEEYITSTSQIDAATLDAMKKQAEDAFMAKAATWSVETVDSNVYVGNYFLNVKEGVTSREPNAFYLVYQTSITNTAKEMQVVYYQFYKFHNLKKDSMGTVIVDLNDYEGPSSSYKYYDSGSWFYTSYYVNGYETLDGLYKDAIQTRIDQYTFENNVNK